MKLSVNDCYMITMSVFPKLLETKNFQKGAQKGDPFLQKRWLKGDQFSAKRRPPRLSRAPNRTPKLVPLRLFIILREGGPVQQNALEFFREGGPVQPNALVSERHNRHNWKNQLKNKNCTEKFI